MMEIDSIMSSIPFDTLNQRIAQRVGQLRAQQGLSLDALATRSGVSRSMISLIERAESSPTAVVLEKLATGLGVALASLFDTQPAVAEPVARAKEQLPWRDPQSGYLRRNVSPPGFVSPMQIVDVHLPAAARVAYETAARLPRMHQQVWVLEGTLHISVGAAGHLLHCGDCLAFVLDQPTVFHNPTRKATRYAVVIVAEHG